MKEQVHWAELSHVIILIDGWKTNEYNFENFKWKIIEKRWNHLKLFLPNSNIGWILEDAVEMGNEHG